MSKKTSTKATKTKSTKKASKAAKPVAIQTGACPKGGGHEWTDEGGENF
jgi:hypothetical protein